MHKTEKYASRLFMGFSALLQQIDVVTTHTLAFDSPSSLYSSHDLPNEFW